MTHSFGAEHNIRKGNELAAIREMLGALNLKGCVASIDAIGCHKGIIETTCAKGWDAVMSMDKGIFPVTEEFFSREIEPIIEDNYIWKCMPPKISHYKVFCAI